MFAEIVLSDHFGTALLVLITGFLADQSRQLRRLNDFTVWLRANCPAAQPCEPANQESSIRRWLPTIFVASGILFLFAGCVGPAGGGTPWQAVSRPLVASTNVTAQVVLVAPITNTVPVPSQVIAGGQVVTVTNYLQEITPPRAVTNWHTNIVYEVNPATSSTIATVRTVTGAIPSPVGTAVDIALAGLAAGLGWFARFKTRKAEKSLNLLQTVVAGVEEANNPEVKAVIEKVARARQIQRELDPVIQQITKP